MNKLSIKIFSVVIVIALAFTGATCYALGPSNNQIYEGVDVSAWQGYIDYERVKNAGIDIVYMKTSQGNDYIDPHFRTNYTNAKANGLKVGFYHFVTARNTEEAVNEARFFARVISGTNPDCRLAMDFETLRGLSANEVNAISFAFLRELVDITNKEAIIYSDAYNAREMFSAELAQEYPLWVAEYGVEEPIDNGKWSSWVGFQFTSGGNVPGISGRVDRDKFTSDVFLSDTVNPVPEHNRPTNSNVTRYVVQRGNTLWGISREFGTTVDDIATLNNIVNPNLIFPGEDLVIPTSDNEVRVPKYIIYTIKWGDTLNAISARYNVPVRTLVELNDIQNPNLIYAGDKIRI